MRLEFSGQPYRTWASGGSFLGTALQDPDIDRFLIVTAWVRSSGISQLAPALQAARRRGAKVEALVGIDLNGTTRQGLELLRKSSSSVHVVHDPSGRTFHPKLYLALGPRRGYVLVGSNNLTAGGLGHNYEAAMLLHIDPLRESDFVGEIDDYVRRLINDKPICKRLTPAILRRLDDEGWLSDEETDRRHRGEDRTSKPASKAGSAPLFTASKEAKRTSERGRTAGGPPVGSSQSSRSASKQKLARMASAPDTWSKRLGPGDAQRLTTGHLTHRLRLTPPPRQADPGRFFRDVFFGQENWTRMKDGNGRNIDVVEMTFEVSIDGQRVGPTQLEVTYAKHRDAKSRTTTDLSWGPLMQRLRARDHTHWYVLIERDVSGAFGLRLMRSRPV